MAAKSRKITVYGAWGAWVHEGKSKTGSLASTFPHFHISTFPHFHNPKGFRLGGHGSNLLALADTKPERLGPAAMFSPIQLASHVRRVPPNRWEWP